MVARDSVHSFHQAFLRDLCYLGLLGEKYLRVESPSSEENIGQEG
jgi:hypothetical protein